MTARPIPDAHEDPFSSEKQPDEVFAGDVAEGPFTAEPVEASLGLDDEQPDPLFVAEDEDERFGDVHVAEAAEPVVEEAGQQLPEQPAEEAHAIDDYAMPGVPHVPADPADGRAADGRAPDEGSDEVLVESPGDVLDDLEDAMQPPAAAPPHEVTAELTRIIDDPSRSLPSAGTPLPTDPLRSPAMALPPAVVDPTSRDMRERDLDFDVDLVDDGADEFEYGSSTPVDPLADADRVAAAAFVPGHVDVGSASIAPKGFDGQDGHVAEGVQSIVDDIAGPERHAPVPAEPRLPEGWREEDVAPDGILTMMTLKRRLPVAGIVVAVLALVVGGFVLTRGGDTPTPPVATAPVQTEPFIWRQPGDPPKDRLTVANWKLIHARIVRLQGEVVAQAPSATSPASLRALADEWQRLSREAHYFGVMAPTFPHHEAARLFRRGYVAARDATRAQAAGDTDGFARQFAEYQRLLAAGERAVTRLG